MPVLGLAHYDTERDRIEYLQPEEALKRARQRPDVYGDPAIIAEALRERQGIDADWTASELFSFGRLTLFRKLFGYYVPVKQAWPTIRGKAVHRLFEDADLGSEVMKEMRLSVPVPHPDDMRRTLKVSGQFDVYYEDTRTLVDYKTTSKIPSEPYEGHVLQVNTYAQLLRLNHYEVDRIYLVYLNFQRHVVVPVRVIPEDEIWEAIRQTAWFLQECVENRVLPPRREWCNPLVEQHFCPFYQFCRENPDWVQVPEGAVFAEDRMWTAEDWQSLLGRR